MNIIFNEDLFDTVKRPELNHKIDAIITSPPYNTSRVGSSDEYGSRYDTFEDYKTDEDYIDWTVNIFNAYDDILKKDGVILYNMSYGGDKPYLMWLTVAEIIKKTNFTTADTLVWKKSNALPNNMSKNKLTRIVEYVFVFVRKKEIKTFNTNKKILSRTQKTNQAIYENIYNFFEAKNNDGSTQLNKATFSSEFVKQLIDIYVPVNSLVYDSFMGTGSTAVGCVERSMQYVGSEISSEQCKYAEERIGNAVVENTSRPNILDFC